MVRGDAPVRSSDLRKSVSWLNDKVKGISKLRLNQDELGTVGGQLNSARWSVMVWAGVVGSWAVMGWWDLDMNHQGSVGLGLRQGTQDDVLGLVFGQSKGEKSSWTVISEKWKDQAVEMDTRQRDKEKEKEKDVPPWEITPKIHPFFSLLLNLLSIMLCDVIGLMETRNAEPRPWPVQRLSLRPCLAVLWSDLISRDRTWTVVKERCREDSSQGKMCGEWVIVDRCEGTKRTQSRKGKEAAGASVPVVGDGTNPTQHRRVDENARTNRRIDVSEELGRYVATGQRACAVVAIRTKLYLGNILCDVLLTEHDLLRKDILVFCGDLDVNFVVTVFDPNKHHTPALSPWGQLKISSTQLGGVLWSGPVWSGHGRLWARPKGEEEQLDGYIRKGAKGTVLCPFPLTDCAGFLRAVGRGFLYK
ncbi:hypothetical protein F2Q69_00027509 [Brassica cretica]|uniref:Uncharacterized protein n=1 Tax=Brassica cretica TaxID=69181 RepID=A0A8S9S1J5_BRACR|nr:hypothetical protein F2Q69_00027509 [Brassica cretica]